MHYLLPVASQETEQKVGISSGTRETILAADLLWNLAHHQYSGCLLFWLGYFCFVLFFN